MAAALFHHTIDREALAGFDQYQIAEAQLGNGHVFFPAIDQTHGPFRAQGFEGSDGAGGLAFGTAFQVLAQQHQGNHHGRGFEVQVRGHAGGGLRPLVQAQAIAGAGAQGHQQVHVAGTGAHGLPGSHVEPRAKNELHRCGQQELHPRWQHPVHAKRLHQHGHHQRQG